MIKSLHVEEDEGDWTIEFLTGVHIQKCRKPFNHLLVGDGWSNGRNDFYLYNRQT